MSDDEHVTGQGPDERGEAEPLRARAEERARRSTAHWPSDLSHLELAEAQKLVQELRIHQIELEIQNEELRRTQGELNAARERYFDLYDLAPVGYFTLGETGEILEANLTGANLLGEDRSALVAHRFTRFIAPSHQDTWYRAHRRLRATTAPQTFELEMRRADTTVFYGRLNVTLVEDAQGQASIRATVSDISAQRRLELERQRLERRLRQAEKSESLGRMAGAIAHHFNNLLGAVTGNIEIALRDVPSRSETSAALDDALAAARRAAATSKLLLTYLGQAEGRLVPRDLSEVVRRALPALRAAMPPRLHLEDDLPSPGPTVAVIPGQVELVLTNLLINACEAADELSGEGAVRLALRTVGPEDVPTRDRFPVDWTPQHESYARLTVADPGSGIQPGSVEQVFDPFYSTKSFGRGLGLPVALGAVRAHGGAMAVRSGPGVESTMVVYLPVSVDATPEPWESAEENVATEPATGTVLVVDDEVAMRRMAARVLDRLGYAVLLAESGAEAVALFQEHQARISWVLCDLTMQGMNGWQTLAALRAVSPTVQVVLTSGFDEAHAMSERGSVEPPHAFLSKPWSVHQLAEVAP